MIERIISIGSIDPLDFYGINNSKLDIIKVLFPKLQIVGRGDELIVKGEQKILDLFENKINLILQHYDQYNVLTAANLKRIVLENTNEIDDPEDPTIQEELLEKLGAEVINNPFKKVCCGSYQTVQDKNIVVDLSYSILTRAQKEGAEAITTSCPLCAFNLDNRQKEVKGKYPHFKEIPVFYFTQLMSIAFGLDKKYCRFDLNFAPTDPTRTRIVGKMRERTRYRDHAVAYVVIML